jgi:hypothetical protein
VATRSAGSCGSRVAGRVGGERAGGPEADVADDPAAGQDQRTGPGPVVAPVAAVDPRRPAELRVDPHRGRAGPERRVVWGVIGPGTVRTCEPGRLRFVCCGLGPATREGGARLRPHPLTWCSEHA